MWKNFSYTVDEFRHLASLPTPEKFLVETHSDESRVSKVVMGTVDGKFQESRNLTVPMSLIRLFSRLTWKGLTKRPVLPPSSAKEKYCLPKAAAKDWAQPPDARKLGVYGYPRMAYTWKTYALGCGD